MLSRFVAGALPGTKQTATTLAAYFTNGTDARKALWELERRGYSRAALLHRASDRDVRVRDLFFELRLVRAGMIAVLLAAAGILFPAALPLPAAAGGAALLGLLLGWLTYPRSRFGIHRRVLAEQAQWLLVGESVLLLEAPLHDLREPQLVLRESSETQPTIFLLLPRRETAGAPPETILLPQDQLERFAGALAEGHRRPAAPLRGAQLLRQAAAAAAAIRSIWHDLSDAHLLEQPVTTAAEWLLDNEYIVENNARDVRANLPRKYFRELPVLDREPFRRLPRVYGLAKEFLARVDLRLTRDNLLAFLEAYQSVQPLAIGELWALPQMLRIALIERIRALAEQTVAELREREIAGFWANRLIAAGRQDPGRVFTMLAKLIQEAPAPSDYFSSQLTDYLYDEANALSLVQNWLDRTLPLPLGALAQREQNRQIRAQISIGNAFSSLRALSLIDWRTIFEQVNRTETLLRRDPAGVYPQLDFETRNRYRQAVEEMARDAGLPEEAVAEQVLAFAAEQREGEPADERLHHVGFYLVAEGRAALRRRLGCRRTLRCFAREWLIGRHPRVYLGGLTAVFLLLLAPAVLLCLQAPAPWLRAALIGLFVLPLSQAALEIVNYAVTRILPPRPIAKLDFEKTGIPDQFRTLVVVPTLLVDAATVRSDVERLEVRFLGNQDPNLFFALLSDFEDADSRGCPDDAPLLRQAVEALEALNARYGGRFFLFHREREWSESEQAFIGRERKRGKLEELHQFLAGSRPGNAPPFLRVGNPARLTGVRFILTLDSDTHLPPAAARRMIGALAHPLNAPRFDSRGNIAPPSFTILQPRVSPSLPSALATPFSRLFADPVGVDPYTRAVSDVYQDLVGGGSFNGKGLYDWRAFHRVLAGRFPEERLLSHDLIEGEHVGTALASDIELFDEFPPTYYGYAHRQHRWIRGDWQICDWLLPTVPLAGGKRGPNRLSAFSRWKIFDNLRRSLTPISLAALLPFAGFLFPPAAWAAAGLAAFLLWFNPLSTLFTGLTGGGLDKIQPARLGHDALRGLAEAALLPRQAGWSLDAILKVWHRRWITHRGFLRWTSARVVHRRAAGESAPFLLTFLPYAALSLIALAAVIRLGPAGVVPLAPWLILWTLSPILAWIFDNPARRRPERLRLPSADREYLRTVARRTWQFFADCINEATAWLPPDNYQVSHQNRLALRTSPTNIGLSLISTLAARGFGYQTVDQAVERLARAFETIGRLERYNGHLLNWYDLQTLRPLEPRYVSTVDSGNLLAALYAIESGLPETLRRPVLDESVFAGLADTLALVRQGYAAGGRRPRRRQDALDRLAEKIGRPPASALEAVRLLRGIKTEGDALAQGLAEETGRASDASVWICRMQEQTDAWVHICDRYLQWQETAADMAEGLPAAGRDLIRGSLERAPSLAALAAGGIPALQAIAALRKTDAGKDPAFAAKAERAEEEASVARWLAGETLGAANRVLEAIGRIRGEIDLRFLYDGERRLFSIGYNVSEGRLDPSYYDLLASEARLGSYLAVARGEAPLEHWFALGRPYRAVGRRRPLVSWTGTMFEYLMPILFQRLYQNSLLDKAVRDAVAVQIGFGRRRGIPWGLSESAFGDLDVNRNYQYKAFGVPALGLKRLSEDELVVAPYATLLALELAPRESVANLRRLERSGLLGQYGFYDAVDFSRTAGGRKGILIRTFMAHHQSMGFLALANLLQGGAVRRYFHSRPEVAASELLLQERIPYPPPAYVPVARERGLPPLPAGEAAVEEDRFDTPHTLRPRTLLLGHENYSVMITNSGGGWSRWRRQDVTRWRLDRTGDSRGTFVYLRDPASGKTWSAGYHPVGGEVPEEYSVQFALDRALIRRRDNSIDCATEIFVSAEDDVEIRRLTLINRSLLPRTIELSSYVELVMAPHAADLQHSAFQRLFVRTEAVPSQRTLLAARRPRAPEDGGFFVAHRWTLSRPPEEPFQFETDRSRFIGRGRTPADPLGLTLPTGNTQGTVLDPILSIRERVTLEPGQRVQAALVLAAGETREIALALAAKYGDPHAVERAADFSLAAAQIELRSLHVYPDDARQFQKLAGHMLYASPLLRTSAEEIEKNRKGQSALWPYGISGDLPILTASIGDSRDLGLIRQVLQAHSYWRKRGFWSDLVILDEEFGGYELPLKEELEGILRGFALNTGLDQPGGIFLRHADQIAPDDLVLLRSVSNAVLVASRGALAQQLGIRMEVPELPAPIVRRRPARDPSALLPFMELPYFNSLGGFTPDGREYAIYLGPGTNTPAPWINVLANPSFGAIVSEVGSGCTWSGNSQRNRLTAWSNDAVLDPPAEAVYLRDEDTGAAWTPTAAPIREESAYRARHGAGYTVFEHSSNGIQQELTVLVPLGAGGDESVKLQRLRLKNDTARKRRLTVNYFVEWTLGENRESTQMHVFTRWDSEARALTAYNRYHPEYGDRVAFATLDPPPESYSADRFSFLGRNRGPGNPAALERVRRSRRVGAKLDPSAALQAAVELNPGETREVYCLLGQAGSVEEMRELVAKYRVAGAFDAALAETGRQWDDLLGGIQIHTPELSVDLLVNRWLPYQALACRLWARTAFYQSGGAYGFRDQLQDSLAFLYTRPEITRGQILRAAGRQFGEGDVQHWWHPPTGAGVRTRIADDPLWLVYAAAEYVGVTGDAAILGERIPFLSMPVLEAGKSEAYGLPETGPDRADLFEHCRRAVECRLDFGAHGLPKMGAGDWDDGLNRVGAEGRGESVWLGWFLAEALRGLAGLADRSGRSDLAADYRRRRGELMKSIETAAWDGAWYRRAFFDDGSPLGTASADEARIFSLPQSWAVLGGGADSERCAAALDAAWEHLVRGEEGLALLFDPPFQSFHPFPGYIQGYPPGVRENGGQYSHAAVWLAMAFARRGDGDRARGILRMINPIERARDPDTVWRYGREPYAVAADIYSAEGQTGHGGWSWYTGSAGWMYRAWVEEMIGLKIRDGRLRVDPTLPREWDRAEVRFRSGESVYEIRIENPDHVMHGVAALELDGRPAPDGGIPLDRSLVLHRITVRLGKTA